MLSNEELKERQNYLGASEAAGVLGLSRWQTPLSIWAAKTGQLPPPEEESLPAWVGDKMESIVAQRYMMETGKEVYSDTKLYLHPQYGFIGCHLDRRIRGEGDAILECKTTTAFKSKEWDDGAPTEYLIQALHIMACTDTRRVDIACLIGNHRFVIVPVKYNAKLIKNIIDKEVAFWHDFVEPGIMPYQITQYDSDILYQLFPVPREDEIVELDDSANLLCEEIESMSQDAFALDAVIKRKKNELRAMLKDYEVGSTGRWRITWKLIEKAAHQVAASKYRELRISKIKRETDNEKAD